MDTKELVAKGIIAHKEGDFDKAIDFYYQALKMEELPDFRKATIYFNLALAYWKKEDLKNAEKCFLLSIKHSNKHGKKHGEYFVPPLSELGKLYYDLDKYRKAKKVLKDALALDLQNPNANYYMSIVYYELADYKKAIEHANVYLAHGNDKEIQDELKELIAECHDMLRKKINNN